METIAATLYGIGDAVLSGGNYVCVPCGFVKHFEAGEFFTTCEACFAGTEAGPAGYQESAAEFWQFIG